MEGTTIALVGLIVVLLAHIAVIARWSGRIDGLFQMTFERIAKAESEITRLRDARHAADGVIQRHTGEIRDLYRADPFNRRMYPRDEEQGA